MSVDKILEGLKKREPRAIGRAISLVENGDASAEVILSSLDENLVSGATVLGITGPPGAGKSTLTNRIIASLRQQKERIGIIAIDPTSPISGGAILGDRIRMMQHATAVHGHQGQTGRTLRHCRCSGADHGRQWLFNYYYRDCGCWTIRNGHHSSGGYYPPRPGPWSRR